jgi:hypothetical protein
VGTFPFGRPATDRPPRVPAGDADLFVLGVYPSALHVRWQRPDGAVQVQALAVDDEPEVFWDGADAAERVRRWCGQVGWQPKWGCVSASGNGTSGQAVIKDVLRPLGTTMERCFLTDCLPRYHVKHGAGSQGNAMSERYAPFAAARGLPIFSLPRRPSPSALVRQALRENGANLADQLRTSRAEIVVTLGEEAADVFATVVGAERVALRRDAEYGKERRVPRGHGVRTWIPLKHPGLRDPRWRALHDDWVLRRA